MSEQVPSDAATKRVFTTGEAAAICKVSQQTIIRCFDNGRLTGFRVPGSKFRRIPREELLRFMRANSIPLDALEGTRKRVLIVDDDPGIVEVYQELFGADARLDVKTATNGYDAGMLTESFRPHLVVLDYMLPDINGNVVCQTIRKNPNFEHTKIVIVSGVVNQDEINDLLKSGADEFVKKPFNIEKLIERIGELLAV